MGKGIDNYNTKKTNLLLKQGYCCAHCKEPFKRGQIIDLAHRIPKTVANIKAYGIEVIDHIDNLGATHRNGYKGRSCNDSIMIGRGSQPVKAEKLYRQIKEKINV